MNHPHFSNLSRRRPLAVCAVLLFFNLAGVAGALAADGDLQSASIGDLRLQNGQVIRDCKIGYRTFGTLNAQKSNAILFPTWFTGTTQGLVGLVGPGKLVDSSQNFIILVDALGDGVSSSPSNSATQPHMQFPRFSIRDMVESQHLLLTRNLHIEHLKAVMGISMGGMQTFQWFVAYPGFMDKAIPIVGSPQLTSYDLLLWQAEKHGIQTDPAWQHGDYTSPPVAGMAVAADIHSLALTTPDYRVEHTPPADFPKFLKDTEASTLRSFDANDWIRQLQAMMAQNVFAPFGGSQEQAAAAVKARVLVVAALQDHMVNPHPALNFARLIHAQTLELNSDCGHLSTGCEEHKISAALASFLSAP